MLLYQLLTQLTLNKGERNICTARGHLASAKLAGICLPLELMLIYALYRKGWLSEIASLSYGIPPPMVLKKNLKGMEAQIPLGSFKTV